MAPPKKPSPEVLALMERFQAFGLSQSKSLEVARQPAQATSLKTLLEEQNLEEPVQDKNVALLLVCLADKGKSLDGEQRRKVCEDVMSRKLQSTDQVTGQLSPRRVSIG